MQRVTFEGEMFATFEEDIPFVTETLIYQSFRADCWRDGCDGVTGLQQAFELFVAAFSRGQGHDECSHKRQPCAPDPFSA